mmetsp:Transcript_43787/g.171285  ORF Transcript_43787/g.171285 Transcript_43787/m.171285 type:complete len:237 (+) Transcript_43787:1954-2664(+)
MLLIDNTNYRRARVLSFPEYSGRLVAGELRNNLHQLCGYVHFVISFVAEENDLVHRDLICVGLVLWLRSLLLGLLFDFRRRRTTSDVRFWFSNLSLRFTYLYPRRNHIGAHRLNSHILLHPSQILPPKNGTPNKSHDHRDPKNNLSRLSPHNRKTKTPSFLFPPIRRTRQTKPLPLDAKRLYFHTSKMRTPAPPLLPAHPPQEKKNSNQANSDRSPKISFSRLNFSNRSSPFPPLL